MSNYIPSTGDIVKVSRNDGKVYDCFVIESLKDDNLFYGRVLESSRDKVPTTCWKRYGLEDNCIVQAQSEAKSVELLTKSNHIVVEDLKDTHIYRNRIPGTSRTVTLSLSEGFGGWSEDRDEDSAIFESCSRMSNSKKEDTDNGPEQIR